MISYINWIPDKCHPKFNPYSVQVYTPGNNKSTLVMLEAVVGISQLS